MEGVYKQEVYLLPSIVRLGVRSLKCKRHGICEVKILDGFQHMSSSFDGKSYAVLQVNGNHLTGIHFLRASMSEKTLKKYFRNNVFTVEKSYRFDLFVHGCEVKCEIREGEYSALFELGYFSVNVGGVDGELAYPSDLKRLYLSDCLEVSSR